MKAVFVSVQIYEKRLEQKGKKENSASESQDTIHEPFQDESDFSEYAECEADRNRTHLLCDICCCRNLSYENGKEDSYDRCFEKCGVEFKIVVPVF